MKILENTIILIIGIICFGCSTTRGETILSAVGDLYTLSFADMSFSVSPEQGGRIVVFESGNNNILTTKTIHDVYYGATFWVSPQSNYWPQDKNIDGLPYTSRINEKTIKLSSQTESNSNFFITKMFEVSEKDTAIVITYTVKNISPQPKELAPWDVTRVHGGLSFYPVGENNKLNKSDVKGAYENDSIMWYPFPKERNEKGQKLFWTARDGWLAHYYNGLLLVKCFPDIKPTEVPPDQGEVEIFVAPNGNYLELENHGKYTTLSPQQVATYKQKWFIRNVKEKQQSELLSIVQRLTKTAKEI